ncbi:enoyl-CoA hydratase/isomerase family protein [Streptomyces zhaozhouensis]|nr:enoyl-CoA hydratase-related protein [Streptomyces zhaozhouensis]
MAEAERVERVERFGDWIELRRDGETRVATLLLDRPEALNALSAELAARLAEACAELAADRATRAVVLGSTHERAFCVGADLKERNGLDDAGLRRQRRVLRAAFGGVLGLPMPVIAAVRGFALGGGYELALSCDLVVADESAVVGLPEVSVGVLPGGGGTQLLPRRVGAARAAELVFTARKVPAAEALTLGMVDQVVPTGSEREEALALAGRIARNSPVGVRAAKRALRLGHGQDLATGLEVEDAAWNEVAFSPDRVEGIAAFNERRAPDWPGCDG